MESASQRCQIWVLIELKSSCTLVLQLQFNGTSSLGIEGKLNSQISNQDRSGWYYCFILLYSVALPAQLHCPPQGISGLPGVGPGERLSRTYPGFHSIEYFLYLHVQ
jgi:hypothetical protein